MLRNVVVAGSGRYGLNSAFAASHVNISGLWSEGSFNQTTPAPLRGGDPLHDGSLKYLTRVEDGSPLAAAGQGGHDLGATLLHRYGRDAARHGEPGYREPTNTPLWPWPNEARIKAEMCAVARRGFCSQGKRLDGLRPVTLSSHVWEALGHPAPLSVAP